MKINCIIVEDEPLALERTAEYVKRLPFLNLLATFDDAIEALGFVKGTKVDLIFLDINLGNFSGIQLLQTSAIESQVIITTAYQEHAVTAFDLKVADYLLKPFSFERFIQAVDRVRGNFSPTPKVLPPVKNYIFVKTEYRLEKIFLRDILFIEGMRDYRRIHAVDRRIMTLQSFTQFERQIPRHIVCRVHKSYMVAPDKIGSIEKDRIRIGDQSIPISESYKQRFFELIGHAPK